MRCLRFCAVLACLGLAGCTSPADWDYLNWDYLNLTVLHQLPQDLYGKTFYLSPQPDGQTGTLPAGGAYGAAVAKKLQAHGLIQVDSLAAAPDYVVAIDYNIDQGRSLRYDVPIYGATGGGNAMFPANNTTGGTDQTSSFSATVTQPRQFGEVADTALIRTVFGKSLRVLIFDRAASDAKGPKIVYDGEATASGGNAVLAKVLPQMITDLLKDFPGKNQSTWTATSI